ncbi:MAG TPA: glycosyltransferase family 1 protein [Sphingomicrobium sp.]|nr:glycosyltransferase family 1 protein [Sphingomicrobium sp.]
MKLGINGWRLRTGTGVARVLNNVLRYWTQEFVGDRFDDITVYSPVELAADLPIPGWIKRRVVGPDLPMLAWENLVLPMACGDDVLLCPSYTRPLLTGAKTVSLIYEATQKLYPEYYPTRARFINTPLHGWSARHSTRVITKTEQARADIEQAYGAPPERVRVVPLAPAEVFRSDYPAVRLAEVRTKYAGADVPYFLYVGKLTARRNVPHLLTALAKMRDSGSFPHRLVIVGLNTTQIDLAGMARELGISEEVKYYPYVPDEDLAPLYSAAEAFVLPYSYESAASLTLLEAQAAGTAVVTAGTVGLKQAAGDAALFVPDVEPASLATAMREVAGNPAIRADLLKRGGKNASAYSWRRCSGEVLDICREAGTA